MNIAQRRSFHAILSVLFLDNLGLTVVYPIFTPLVLKPIYTLLPPQYPLSIRLILLGVLIASFPFAQFIAGPIIGHIADKKGRKFAFILALVGEGIGFFLTGLSIEMMNYTFLIFSRLFTGFFAGNMTICLSAISDMTVDVKGRSRNFGIVSSVVGISFVVAIVIGGTLSNDALNTFFNSSLPFWAMALFSIVNIGIISLKFQETHTEPPQTKNYFIEGCRELLKISNERKIKYLYGTFFFFMLGWVVSLQFLSSFLIEHFTKEKLAITLTFVGVGLAWCVGNIGINRILIRFFKPGKILFYTLLLSTFCLFLTSEVRTFLLFIHLIIIGGLSASIAWTNCLALISIKAPSHLQGKLLGVNQSVATISMAFAPLFGGMVGEFDIRTIYLFASGSLLISMIILIIYKLKNRF
ncbi:MAG: MFS transporter [Simkaniaceae bacterium]|nr:MAG: MFS transporter [Simkaniaceae bacterium]